MAASGSAVVPPLPVEPPVVVEPPVLDAEPPVLVAPPVVAPLPASVDDDLLSLEHANIAIETTAEPTNEIPKETILRDIKTSKTNTQFNRKTWGRRPVEPNYRPASGSFEQLPLPLISAIDPSRRDRPQRHPPASV